MKSAKAWFQVVFLGAGLLFICPTPDAFAQNIRGKWGVGLRVGPSILTQDVSGSIEANTGPIISGNILYGLTDNFSMGLNLEWETHQAESVGDIGDINIFSLIPFIEFRPGGRQAFSPYASLGIGININSFNEESGLFCVTTIGSGFCKIEPENTFALKFAGGFDYFVTPNLALNAEIGWKLNSGDSDVKVSGVGTISDDFRASVFNLLFGLRYYF